MVVSIHMLSPLIALIAGILILVMPRLLNYVIALYLIVTGLLGLFGSPMPWSGPGEEAEQPAVSGT